jgi:hypothetical protein
MKFAPDNNENLCLVEVLVIICSVMNACGYLQCSVDFVILISWNQWPPSPQLSFCWSCAHFKVGANIWYMKSLVEIGNKKVEFC